MIKFLIPVVIVIVIVLSWDQINATIYKKFKIKINYIILILILLFFTIIASLLYF